MFADGQIGHIMAKVKSSGVLVDDHALIKISEAQFWNVIQYVVHEMFNAQNNLDHQRSFQIFAVLVMSPFGGFSWTGAETELANLTYGNVEHIVNRDGDTCLYTHRFGVPYPITVHPIVIFALVRLIYQRMRVLPCRNNAPRKLLSSDYLAPNSPQCQSSASPIQRRFRIGLIEDYLSSLSARFSPLAPITIEDFCAASRRLMVDQYDLDVLYAMLGKIQTYGVVPTDGD